MKRTRLFLGALFAAALLAGTAVVGSTAATQGPLKGYEVLPSNTVGTNPATFVGLIPTTGVWMATISHGTLDTQPGGVTTITGGTFQQGTGFTFSWAPPFITLSGAGPPLTIPSGEIVAGPPVGGAGFCTQTFTISGALSPVGIFSGTLRHYGEKVKGSCEAEFASVTVTVTTP